MTWLQELFTAHSAASAVLILSLVAALGLAIGSIRVLGVSLGIAGVLFAGLLFGHFKFALNEHVIEFVREFGLILFVYTIGMQVGPGFISSLRRQGLPLNIMAFSIVVLGVLLTVLVTTVGGVQMPVALGLFAGATTNTPALAAAQQALKDVSGYAPEMAKMPGLGYAVAYPFGIVGIILTMIILRIIFRINAHAENKQFIAFQNKSFASVTTTNIKVTNPNLDGLTISKIPALAGSGVIISRVLHDDDVSVAQPDTIIRLGDIIHVVGPREKLDEFCLIIGCESEVDVKTLPSRITTQRIAVTRSEVLGKSLDELEFLRLYDVTITRVSRADLEFTPRSDFRLQFGDTVLAVGEEDDIPKVARELGNSLKHLNYPQIIPVFVGIALGVILGSIPFYFPGMPAAVRLGLAGGPLLVAIVLSRIGRIGPLIWYMPISANFILREVGIVLFLACVGLRSGDRFVETLTHGQGLYWMACGALITFVPLIIVGLAARLFNKLNYMSLCGLLAGSMTDPPALAFASSITTSDAPYISYATVYPMVMIARVLSAQLLVLLLPH